MDYSELKKNKEIQVYYKKGNDILGKMGYTDHSVGHAELVAQEAAHILDYFGYSEHEVELARIAGYLHDIGNSVSRDHHGQSSAFIAMSVLTRMGMDPDEVAIVMAAVGNHEEEYGHPVNEVAAAVILADKSDVHRTRVSKRDIASFDIHDRVSYAAERSFHEVDAEQRLITLTVTIDTEICPVMDYFEIFLTRMLMCRRAAEVLDCEFKLEINGVCLL